MFLARPKWVGDGAEQGVGAHELRFASPEGIELGGVENTITHDEWLRVGRAAGPAHGSAAQPQS